MPTYFQRPENALKRANEFIDVGKKQRALDALYDVIKSKKHRTWQKIHEPIMEKYLQLCVELRKSHIAKEGLYQYKNICQQVNIKSLEDVVRKYINLAEFKTEEARQESHQVVVDIDDLEQPDTPESLLLKVVSGEDTQDRTDRAILTPWVKFLWESYRQCLDLLRNNSRVERLYQDIAQQAFKFCFKYGRKTEFRKLCDNLRTHLSLVHKHQHQQTAINLNNPDSQAMHLETRLVQLDNAINMELWQEAFKAVEDIHGLIGLSKKPPKPSLMANYYQKLGLVFWKSGNQLFHASTLHRMFHLSREQRKNLSPEELQKMASRVLCATLAIPIPASRNAIDQLLESDEGSMEKQRRLAQLLMLQNPPKRTALIKDLAKYNVLQYVSPELQNLYQWLEVEFHPLKLHERVKSSMEFINQNDDLNQYLNSLEEIVITRVLKQVSQVYQTIEFSRLAALVPFSSKFRLERLIVETALTLELQVRIDHRSKSLSFGTDLMVAQKEDVPEGPYIQSMPSEQIRNQLTSMSRCLHKAMTLIQPEDRQSIRDELRVKIANSYRMTAKKDHVNVLQRRNIIEQRKEQLEHMNDQREKEEMEQQEEQKKKAYDAEMARLEREAKERERQRKVEEHKEMQKKHAQERIEQLRKTELGAKVLQNMDEDDIGTLDIDDIMAKQVEQLEKEKKELNERLKSQDKKIDFFARAKRLEEIPLLKKQYESDRQELKGFWEQQEEERIEKVKKERENALQQRDRLSRMKKDKDEFVNMLRGKRKEQFKQKVKEFDLKMSEERKKRLADRKEKRKEDRRTKWIEEKREAEQRAKDEELLREREEKEQMEKERIEKEEEEYKEKIRRLEEQTAKQRAREVEIEEREKRRREELGSGGGRPGGAPSDEGRNSWKPLQGGGGLGWREREKQRADSWKRDPDAPPQRGDEPPARDDREGWRGRGTPSRDERPPPASDDRGPPPGRDERGPPGDAWRDRRDDRGPPPSGESAWGRDRGRDDRGPPGDAWGRDRNRDDRGPDRNRDDRGPPAESWRDKGRDAGAPPAGSWRDRAAARDSERAPPRKFDRGLSREFDRGPSRDFDRVHDALPPPPPPLPSRGMSPPAPLQSRGMPPPAPLQSRGMPPPPPPLPSRGMPVICSASGMPPLHQQGKPQPLLQSSKQMDSSMIGAPPPPLLKELNDMLPVRRYGPPGGIPPPPPPPTGLPIPKTPFGVGEVYLPPRGPPPSSIQMQPPPQQMSKSMSFHPKQNQAFSSSSPRAQLLSDISAATSAKKTSGLPARGGSARVFGSITKPLSIIEKDIPSQLDSSIQERKRATSQHFSLFDLQEKSTERPAYHAKVCSVHSTKILDQYTDMTGPDSVQKQSNTEELMVDSHASLFDNLRSRKFKKRMGKANVTDYADNRWHVDEDDEDDEDGDDDNRGMMTKLRTVNIHGFKVKLSTEPAKPRGFLCEIGGQRRRAAIKHKDRDSYGIDVKKVSSRSETVGQQGPSTDLADYGIGSTIKPVKTGGTVDKYSINKIFAIQEEDGSWKFSQQLCTLLGIEYDACMKILKEAGIKSLASKIQEEIMILLATSLTLLVIIQLISPDFVSDHILEQSWQQELTQWLSDSTKRPITRQICFKTPTDLLKMVTFYQQKETEYKWTSGMLELGHCWGHVAAKMLHVV